MTLKETMALMRKAEDAVSINGYDFEVNERPAGKGGGGGNGAGDRPGKGGGSKGAAGQLARNAVVTKSDRAKSAYARANSMQLSDVTREMVATLGEDHWESKFEKRPFGVRKPGAHPMGTDNRTKKQKEDAMLAGEKPKSKPSMHHMQMGAGWKKRLGGGGT